MLLDAERAVAPALACADGRSWEEQRAATACRRRRPVMRCGAVVHGPSAAMRSCASRRVVERMRSRARSGRPHDPPIAPANTVTGRAAFTAARVRRWTGLDNDRRSPSHKTLRDVCRDCDSLHANATHVRLGARTCIPSRPPWTSRRHLNSGSGSRPTCLGGSTLRNERSRHQGGQGKELK